MKFKINETEYKVFFRYSSTPTTIRATYDKNDLSQTIISHGLIEIIDVILYNITENYQIIGGTAECQIFDKYNKRLGMNLAVRNLLKNLKILSESVDEIFEYKTIHQNILETFFNFKKNIKYKYLVESK